MVQVTKAGAQVGHKCDHPGLHKKQKKSLNFVQAVAWMTRLLALIPRLLMNPAQPQVISGKPAVTQLFVPPSCEGQSGATPAALGAVLEALTAAWLTDCPGDLHLELTD